MAAASHVDDAAGCGLGAHRRDGAVQDGDGRNASDEWGERAAGQCIGAAAGQAYDAQPFDVERIRHLSHVGDPLAHRAVAMRVGPPCARSFDDDDPQPGPLGRAPSDHRHLTPCAQGAVEPQHHRAGRAAELRVAQLATIGKVKLTLHAWLLDTRHFRRVPQPAAQAHRFPESRGTAGVTVCRHCLSTNSFPAVSSMFAPGSARICRGDQVGR